MVNFKVLPSTISHLLEMNNSTIYYWEKQHKAGLYEGDAVYAVSAKSKTIMVSVREALEQQINELNIKLDLIIKCEELGLKVTES